MSIDLFPTPSGEYTVSDEPSVDELVVRYQQGETHLIDDICRSQHGKTIGLLRYFGVPEQDALDVAQIVFEKMLRALERYEPRGFGSWINRITHNAAIDYHRGNNYRKSRIDNDEDAVFDIPEHHDGIAELEAEWEAERIIELVREVDGPGFDSKQLGEILARVAKGEKNSEIAASLGLNHITVGTRLTRLRSRLAKSSLERESFSESSL